MVQNRCLRKELPGKPVQRKHFEESIFLLGSAMFVGEKCPDLLVCLICVYL